MAVMTVVFWVASHVISYRYAANNMHMSQLRKRSVLHGQKCFLVPKLDFYMNLHTRPQPALCCSMPELHAIFTLVSRHIICT